jgi:molecular chaperone DnaK
MVKDAEANAAADKEKKELVEARNQADSLVYSTEKSLNEHKDKIDSTTKELIEADLQKVKDLLAQADTKADAIKSATESLMQNSMKLGEAIYKQNESPTGEASGAAQDGTNESSSNSGEKVMDAEYEEVKDDDKKS